MKTVSRIFAAGMALVLAQGVYAAPSKVQICHIPPDNPGNFHTITVSEKALPAHLGHGDLAGSCFANAEAICNDGNACTIDAMDAESETCLAYHPPVDCDDSNLCTNDTCDPVDGCQSAPIVCDDGDACTVDACNPFDGQCTGTPIDCGALGICLAGTGLCDFPCDGITCEPIDQCHEAGQCVLPGECVDGLPVADGTACDDGFVSTSDDQCTGGVCEGVATVLTIAVDFSGDSGGMIPGWTTDEFALHQGWMFTPSTNLNVTMLGAYDENSDGLGADRLVLLWSCTGSYNPTEPWSNLCSFHSQHQLLASVVVPAGTGSTLVSSFRFAPIPIVQLTAGLTYAVTAWYPGPNPDALFGGATTATFDSEVTFIWSLGIANTPPDGTFPTPSISDQGFFGPNFLYHSN